MGVRGTGVGCGVLGVHGRVSRIFQAKNEGQGIWKQRGSNNDSGGGVSGSRH